MASARYPFVRNVRLASGYDVRYGRNSLLVLESKVFDNRTVPTERAYPLSNFSISSRPISAVLFGPGLSLLRHNENAVFYPVTFQAVGLDVGFTTQNAAFYAPSVQLRLTAALHSQNAAFYAPRVNLRLRPPLTTQNAVFYPPRFGLGLDAELFAQNAVFYGATLSQVLRASFVHQPAAFYPPDIRMRERPARYATGGGTRLGGSIGGSTRMGATIGGGLG